MSTPTRIGHECRGRTREREQHPHVAPSIFVTDVERLEELVANLDSLKMNIMLQNERDGKILAEYWQ